MNKVLVVLGLMTAVVSANAQTYEADAARMMRTDLTGTARSLGAGGAFSTVGADQSAAVLNPAGIALYRSHEFSISGGMVFGNTNTTYLGQSAKDQFVKGTLSQAGFIFATKNLAKKQKMSFNNQSHLNRVVIGIGFQKVADFNRNDYFFATNHSNSYAQAVATDLNTDYANVDLDHFPIREVNDYNAYVTSNVDTASGSRPQRATMGLPINQIGQVSTKGSLNDINLTIGFNVNDVVYIGVGAGIPYLSYTRNTSIQEVNQTGDSTYTSSLNYTLSGVGVNGRLGVIVKPAPWIRLGAAVQTPTYMRLDENDYAETHSNFYLDTVFSNGSVYAFNYYNPLKATFGASFYIKQWAFISVDYEMDDYTHTHYRFDGNDRSYSDAQNELIAAKYKLASTVRAGAEFAYKSLRLRAGFAWSESPFRSGVAVKGYDGARFNYTAGVGYRGKRFFADLAYVRTQYKDYYTPYSYTDAAGVQEPGIYNNASSNMIVATVGVKFGTNRQ